MKAFIESQFSYCPLRGLRLVYQDYTTPFADLLVRDKSVTIHHRNIQKVAIEMFKVKHNLSPDFIKNLFVLANTYTRSNASFRRPNVNTVLYW